MHATTPSRARSLAGIVTAFFNSASDDPVLSGRMCFAQTVVQFHFTGEPGEQESCCTVWLDSSPIRAEEGLVGDAEVQIHGSPEIFVGMVTGKIDMAMAIVRGEVTYRGPVRKFLRVVPILQSFDFSMFREALASGEQRQPNQAEIDSASVTPLNRPEASSA